MTFSRARGSAAADSAVLGRFGLPLVLFVLALLPRIHELGSPSLSTDEVKWIRRGERMVQRAREGDVLRATAHLSHPGLPAAALIGLGQRWGARLVPGADPVVLARVALAVVGAVVPVLVFLAARPLWGMHVAALGGVFLALDPRHLAVSRTAHLDVVFGLFYGLAVWSFWRRAEEDETRSRLALGGLGAVALALAETTRTSGVVAVLTILVALPLARLRRGRPPFDLGEARWIALAGAIFVLAFGKLWLAPAEIPLAERYPRLAPVERALEGAAAAPAIVAAAALAMLGAAAVLRRRTIGLVAATAGVALGAAVVAPDLVRNLAGFAANLVSSPERLHHRYYGGTGAPIPGKYLTVLVEALPLPILVALVVGFPLFVVRSWQDPAPRGRAGLVVAIAIVVFLVIASQLDKVAFRYLMPIQPMLLLVAAWAVVRAIRAVPALGRRPGAAVAAIAVVLAIDVLPAAPHFAVWESVAGRALRLELGLPPPFGAEGHDVAAEHLWDHAGAEDRVAAIAYDDVLRYYWTDVLPVRRGEERKPMPRIAWFSVDEADHLVLSARRRATLGRPWARFVAAHEPTVAVRIGGEVALEIHDVAAARAREASR